MKLKYYKKDDILVMQFSKNAVNDSFEVDSAILEVDESKAPVSLEILHASNFFNIASKELPADIKQKYFSSM
jgi:uncharacterized protein YuzE